MSNLKKLGRFLFLWVRGGRGNRKGRLYVHTVQSSDLDLDPSAANNVVGVGNVVGFLLDSILQITCHRTNAGQLTKH